MKLVALVLTCTAYGLIVIGCAEHSAPTNSPAPSSAPQSSSGTSTVKPDELATARKLYAENCQNCHGVNGEGGPNEKDGKKFNVPSLKDEHAVKRTDERMVRLINRGDGPMPPFEGKLKPEEIDELVKFVRKEFQGK